MMVDADRYFHPTPEQIKLDEEIEQRVHAAYVEAVPEGLVPKDNGLLCAKPFESFAGDCSSCEYYSDSNSGMTVGGYCKLHKDDCGPGFTCSNYKGEYQQKVKTMIEDETTKLLRKYFRGPIKRDNS